ncbi:hypothetical protein MCOR20_000656 [Pyricularia oryzae]|nr:hypothetical protein MCOR20_000656 [Pyricularia oryzae]
MSYRQSRNGGDRRRNDSYDSRSSTYRPPSQYDRDYRASDSYHPPPPGYDSFKPTQGNFSFRFDKPAGISDTPRFEDVGRAGGGRSGGRDHRRDRRDNRGYRPSRGGRPQPWRKLAADRPILSATHDDNKELSFAKSASGVTYRALDELSDSEEAEMDISDSEDGGVPSKKKRRLNGGEETAANSAPKWSNPDPYTAAPPPDSQQTKRKDVVQLIRKARVQPAVINKTEAPAEAADFISCDFDDSDDDEGEDEESQPETSPRGRRHAQNDSDQEDTLVASKNADAQSYAQTPSESDLRRQGYTNPAHLAPSNDLGSRKRTFDDEIKVPEHAKLKKHTTKMGAGGIVKEWQPSKGMNTCPWVTTDHSDCRDGGVWLHKEIVDFYNYAKPRDFEEKLRQGLIDELAKLIRNSQFRDATVYPFGSFKSNLYLPTGDMDLVFCSDSYMSGRAARYSSKNHVFKFGAFIERKQLAVDNHVEKISKARVPLVKYVDSRTGLKVDVSFENITGIRAIETFLAWREQFPDMPVLVTCIKHFLAMRGLNEPANGGIGGTTVICLVVSMLQLSPDVQSRSMTPESHLGQLLLRFFDLYGNRFSYDRVAISMNPPRYIPKSQVTNIVYRNTDRLSIIDPNNPENDISGGSGNIRTIKAAFSQAHDLLRERVATLTRSPNKQAFSSLLEPIFGGNYTSFEDQRDHLYKLWQRSTRR